jgi:hypothetical protein
LTDLPRRPHADAASSVRCGGEGEKAKMRVKKRLRAGSYALRST